MKELNEYDEATIQFTVWHTGESKRKVTNSYKRYLKGLETDKTEQ